MATIKIKDLPEANQISDSDLVILEDADTTRKAAGQTLIHYVGNHPDINNRFLTRDSLGAAGEAAPLDGTGKLSSDYLNFGKAAGTVYEGSEGKKLEDAVASAAESLDTKADASVLNAHTQNTGIHVSTEEKAAWNAAKAHADSLHARTDATKTESSAANGSIKINGADTKVYTHPDSGAAAGTYTSVTVDTRGHITAGSNPTVPVTQGGTGATTAAAALKNLGISASAAELNILSGAAVTAKELNHLKDTTENVQTQLDGKAAAESLTGHTGNAAVHITAAERTGWNLAKAHADSTHARSDATKTEASATNGNIKINGTDTKVYAHPASGATAGTYTSVTVDSQGHITAGSNPTVPVAKGGTGAVTAAAALKNLGITASAEELNILSGATVTAEELNSLKDATDGIQSQLDEKASAASLNSHTGNTSVHISAAERTNWNLAKTHADSAHARTDATKTEASTTNGSIKINGTDTKVYAHPASGATAGTYTSVTVDSQGHITAGTNPTVPVSRGGTGAATAAAAIKNLGITATAAEINILSGTTATAKELNSLKDTAEELDNLKTAAQDLQSQMDGKAASASLTGHTGNTTVHITAAERTNWNLAKTHADSAHARTDATKTEASATNGSVKINGTDTKVYAHPVSGATAGTYTSVTVDSQGHITAGTNPTIPVSRGGTGATTAAAALSNLGLTATAAELNKLDGITASTAELNYVKGVTSAIQTQLNGKAAASHGNHVPAIDTASGGKVLKSNGTASAWSALTSQDVTDALGYVPGHGGEYGIATETTPGLIKSGTDITVDTAGNVSVKDNSHSHTVANVTGLQAALDGKSQASHTHSNYASAVTVTGSGNAVTAVSQSGNTITATKGSTFLTAHPAVTMASNTTSSASSVSFSAIDSVTKDTFGHVTKVNTKTVTVPKYTVVSDTEPTGQAASDIWSKEY